jgi:glycosyltransferase involved in cell wall biosynthesis
MEVVQPALVEHILVSDADALAMQITVILCTYNRCQSLVKALDSVSAQVLPESVKWEVLVVDNNSRDQTREVVEDFCRKHPGRFRYLFEPQPGKSHALNAAIREARGLVLAFMDDDVKVEPTWLQNLTAPLRDGRWAGAGGRILPDWTCSPPRWLPLKERYALAPLAVFDLGSEAGPLTEPPFGTNMAYQRGIFEKYRGFRTDLGPRPGSEIRNEDTEFGQRLLVAGELLRYEPSAVVYHSVPENRLKKEYFLKWWYDKGRADIREFGIPKETKWFIARIPLFLFRRLAMSVIRWMTATSSSDRFAAKLKVWGKAGEIVECYRDRAADQVGS